MFILYNVECLSPPEGISLSDYVRHLFRSSMTDEARKDTLFRLTYRLAYKRLKQLENLMPVEDSISLMSIAFMLSYNNYIDKDGSSFVAYYLKAIGMQVYIARFGKYRFSREDREFLCKTEKGFMYIDQPSLESKDYDLDFLRSREDVSDGILLTELYNVIYDILDKMFLGYDWRRSPKSKLLYTDYLNSILSEETIHQYDLALKYDISYSSARHIICRYHNRLRRILKNYMEGLSQ